MHMGAGAGARAETFTTLHHYSIASEEVVGSCSTPAPLLLCTCETTFKRSCTDLLRGFILDIIEQLNAAFHKYALDIFVVSNL